MEEAWKYSFITFGSSRIVVVIRDEQLSAFSF